MSHLPFRLRCSRSLHRRPQPWRLTFNLHLAAPFLLTTARYACIHTDNTAQFSGTTTSSSDTPVSPKAPNAPPYYFLTGHALFAKRPSRPFPPPFLSHPSSSFSDPLSTHNRSIDKRRTPEYEGQRIRGVTNGDDAVLAEGNMIAVGDGVGAWAQKEKGHAALWSRLVLHLWGSEAEKTGEQKAQGLGQCLQKAYEDTVSATSSPTEWFGTTTASGARLSTREGKPSLEVTQLGDSAVLVLRPGRTDEEALLYKTEEQWHWFDCPRQLGTNSPDTPDKNAVTDTLEVEEGDVVVAVSDGVSDNLWVHEIVANVCGSVRKEEKVLTAEREKAETEARDTKGLEAMRRVANELCRAARVIAEDPFAESPFMERAVEEGLPTEGGKLDDISVVVGLCRRRPQG